MIALVLAGLAASAAPLPPSEGSFAIRSAYLDRGDGQRIAGGVVWIDGGKIRAAGGDVTIPAGLPVVEHDGVVSAGLVASHSYDGLRDENHDPTRSVLDGALVADAFAPSSADFERALAAGITTVVLAPSPENLVGGRSAVVKTSGGTLVRGDAQLVLSMSAEALELDRYPTSSQGALAELEERFRRPVGAFAQARAGDRPVLIDVATRDDVLRAVAFAGRHGLKGALIGAPAHLEGLVPDIKRAGLGVVVGPFAVGADPAALRAAVELGDNQVPLGLGLDAPWHHPEELRMSAALCVRAGLAPQAARRALTSDAAAIAGVADRVGRLAPGLDADLVLWSGDPLDLTSSVRAVYVDGHLAYGSGRDAQGGQH